MTLKGRVAVVTGASQGIGRATALMLASYGAKVALAARNAEKLSELEAEIKQQRGEALAVQMDVAREDQIKAGFAKVLERFGRIDILVNNAAIARDQLALRMKRADWDAVLETNLTGAHLCIQQVMPGMLRQRDFRVVAGQHLRRGPPNPLRSSRHHRHPVFERHDAASSPVPPSPTSVLSRLSGSSTFSPVVLESI